MTIATFQVPRTIVHGVDSLEYLKKLDKAKHSDDPYTDDFSHPFLVSTIKKLIQQDDWYEAFDIVKIDLSDTNYQVIYED